jgi:hypothetical protein
MPRRVYALPQNRGVGRREAGASYCGCTRVQLGSCHFEKRTTERPEHRAHFRESRARTVPRVEEHSRPQPHFQDVLGPMEIPHCVNHRILAPLGIRRRTMRNSSESSYRNRVNDVLTELHGEPSGGHLHVNKTPDNVQKK